MSASSADAAAHSKTAAAKPVVVVVPRRDKASALSQKQGQVEAKPVDTRKPKVVICPRKALQPSGIHNNPNLSWQNALANKTNTHASNPPHGGPTKAKSQQQVNLSAKPNAFAFGSKTAALTQKTPEPFPFKGQAGSVYASSTAKSDEITPYTVGTTSCGHGRIMAWREESEDDNAGPISDTMWITQMRRQHNGR